MNYRYAQRARDLGRSIYWHPPATIALGSGLAFPGLLPEAVQEAIAAATVHRSETMQYGPLMGLDELRDEVAEFVGRDGVRTSRDEILITNGAKHGLDLACRVFVEPGDTVIVTAPTYLTAVANLRTHEVQFLSMPQDEEGLVTDLLDRELYAMEKAGRKLPKLLFDIPDFHNPTGITMSLARRKALIELAHRYDFIIVEDDPYRRVRFEGDSVPPIKSLDGSDRVVAIGTVSKILAPGLRVGWAIGPQEIVDRMAAQKSDGGSSPFAQRLVIELIRGNHVTRHVSDLVDTLRVHRDTLVDSLREMMPDSRFRVPSGGYFLWLELPSDVDAEAVSHRGEELGVSTNSGHLSFGSDPRTNFIRLAYSFEGPARIRKGISILSNAYREVLRGSLPKALAFA